MQRMVCCQSDSPRSEHQCSASQPQWHKTVANIKLCSYRWAAGCGLHRSTGVTSAGSNRQHEATTQLSAAGGAQHRTVAPTGIVGLPTQAMRGNSYIPTIALRGPTTNNPNRPLQAQQQARCPHLTCPSYSKHSTKSLSEAILTAAAADAPAITAAPAAADRTAATVAAARTVGCAEGPTPAAHQQQASWPEKTCFECMIAQIPIYV